MRALRKRSMRVFTSMAVVLATLGIATPARAEVSEECFDPVGVPGTLHVWVCPADGSGFMIVHVMVGDSADRIADIYIDRRQDNSGGVEVVVLDNAIVSAWVTPQVGHGMVVLHVCVTIRSEEVCRTRWIPDLD